MKQIVRIVLIALVVVLAIVACSGGVDGNKCDSGDISGDNSVSCKKTSAANATATYGAEQFHIQLTAMASGTQR